MELQSSIEGNNRAIARLQAGYTKEALEILRNSLEELKQQFSSCSDEDVPSLTISPGPCIPVPTSPQPLDNVSNASDPSTSVSRVQFEEDVSMEDASPGKQGVPVVQPVPILHDLLSRQEFPGSETVITPYEKALILSADEQSRETVSAVVLYNMALINHNRGIQRGRASLLKKALRLYRMSLEILFKSDFHSQDVNLLLLALFNNAAQIYAQRYDLAEMGYCLRCMREVLATEPDGPASEDKLSTFFMNTMFYPGEEITMAPAA